MNIDLTTILAQALQEVETFSIPRVGTFTRDKKSAVIDHVKGKVLPPEEKIYIDKGESHTAELEKFVSRKYKLEPAETREIVSKISWLVMGELEIQKKFEIPSIGVIVRDIQGGLIFQPSEEHLGKSFGLEPVSLSKTGQKDQSPSKDQTPPIEKKSGIPEPLKTEHNKIYAELPPVKKEGATPIRKDQENEKEVVREKEKAAHREAVVSDLNNQNEAVKKPGKIAWGWIIVVALLLLLVFGGFYLREDIGNWFAGLQWFKSDPVVIVDTKPAKDTTQAVIPVNPELADKKNKNVNSGTPMVGTDAVRGHHYLVVNCYKNPANSTVFAAQLSAKGYKPVLLNPTISGGFYKLVVFESPTRSEVINKMIESKQGLDYTWIYSR